MGVNGNLPSPPSITHYNTCQHSFSRCCPISPRATGGPHGGTLSKAVTQSVTSQTGVIHTTFLFAPLEHEEEMESICHPNTW